MDYQLLNFIVLLNIPQNVHFKFLLMKYQMQDVQEM
jgi:hypothetical protein